MGSVGGNQINPWAPYDNYRDCSQEICSIYCPQFCYLIFPPPPPFDDGSATPFSPLIIAIIGILTSALVFVSYYTIVTRYCKKRRDGTGGNNNGFETDRDNPDGELSRDGLQNNNGLDENLIKMIMICKYQKGDGLIEGTDCAVCLSEFREDESLRLLPKCSHAFHLPCIDTWLKSQSNCPLCRGNVIVVPHSSPNSTNPVHRSQTSSEAFDVSSYQVHRPNEDIVLVINDQQRNNNAVISIDSNNENLEDLEIRNCNNAPNDREGVDQKHRRSVSLSTCSSHQQLLVSDILRIEEGDEDLNIGCSYDESSRGIGSSKGFAGLIRSPLAMKRSVSTARFVFNINGKGKNSVFQH